jgi:hypothetical protein
MTLAELQLSLHNKNVGSLQPLAAIMNPMYLKEKGKREKTWVISGRYNYRVDIIPR